MIGKICIKFERKLNYLFNKYLLNIMDKISKDEKISVTENTASLKFFRKGERIIHKECYFFILTQILLISTTVLHLVLL